ncbi:MAG: hypothetical protein Q4D21_03915 [Phascolarctobacterium sp.]|nr:hypothetical protein [Phascolarctobacterium sp.]
MNDYIELFKFSGAIIAWVVGGGFATGQEVLRFFSAYGWNSYLVICIDLILFTLITRSLILYGFVNKDQKNLKAYEFYCGKRLAKFYFFMVNISIVLYLSMLISAGGTIFGEHYHLSRFLGSFVFALGLLLVYLRGFRNMISFISKLGPMVIAFAVFIGIYCTVRDFANFQNLDKDIAALGPHIIGYNWLYAGVLYASSNFCAGGYYFPELGKLCSSRKVVNLSCLFGCISLMLTICMTSTSILLNGQAVASYEVPNIYLANSISPVLSIFITLLLTIAIFGSSCADMWSICSQFYQDDRKKNCILAACMLTVCLCFSTLSFSTVLGILAPINGVGGFLFMCLVIYKGFKL